MRSFSDSTSCISGSKASRNPALNPLVVSRRNCCVPHLRSRSPYDFTNPRAAFTSAVRALTSTARARISVRCNCACALRCFTGLSSSGSIRASRASVRASRRSSFRRLLVIKRTFWACPTITSCPSAVNNRLTHGECVPVSIAMQHLSMLLNTCFMASGVVASLCSKTISPISFKTQYALKRSPRSNPIMSYPLKMFSPLVCIVLIFCIAGLLFCALSTSNIGSVSHPAGDRPSHLIWFVLPDKFVRASFWMRQTDAIDDSYEDARDCSQARADQHQTEGHIHWGIAWVRRPVFVITERQEPTEQQATQATHHCTCKQTCQ